ncbi:MAG TPA: sugar-binding transcriptional regulator [Candidatus Limnocylindrales bacterium]|nr:sugar-binding transcriptional regulator [Candidatus Limnocylindrales bacterium]
MPSLDDLGPDEFELLARISNRYFVDGLTQEALGREFGLSRQKVQRLLDHARAAGVVDIRIATPPWLHLDLERAVRSAFGLVEVIVAPERAEPDAQRAAVARAAAAYLERHVTDGMVVAVSHGRDTGEIPGFFRPSRRIAATFVSAMGGSPLADAPTNPNEIVRRLADRCGGQAAGLYAPAYVESPSMRDQLLREPAIADTLALASRASLALVGIGGTDDACTMVRSGCVSVDEIRRLRAAGAVGDVLGHYVDADGNGVESAETGRLVSLSLEALHAIDTVLAVVSEAEKPRALLGVLRTGAIDVLVVDEPNARALLAATREPQPHPATEV